MTKGFPRPHKFVKKVVARLHSNAEIFSNDPKWDGKYYPIPYTGRMYRVGELAHTRVTECKVYRLCIVCGVEVTDLKPWAYIFDNFFVADSGPFHEKCVKNDSKSLSVRQRESRCIQICTGRLGTFGKPNGTI